MKCPVCVVDLKRILYEGFTVLHCLKCHGYLLGAKRLESIKRTDKLSVELLKAEISGQSHCDTAEIIRCSRCLRTMKKQFIAAPASLHIDVCRDCETVWLDGGELARLQLAHQISMRGRDAAEFRRRHRAMTPEQKAQFASDIEKLSSGGEAVGPIAAGSFLETLAMLFGGEGRI